MTIQPDDRPSPCRVCGGRAGVEHITEADRPAGRGLPHLLQMAPTARRYAQVICRTCDARGPQVLFDVSDEWPHIAAERDAVAGWNCLHRVTQCS